MPFYYRNILNTLPGYVYLKSLNFDNIYSNELFAHFGKFESPEEFPDIIDKDMLKNILIPGKFSIEDYLSLFEYEHELAIKCKQIAIFDIHNYQDGQKLFIPRNHYLRMRKVNPMVCLFMHKNFHILMTKYISLFRAKAIQLLVNQQRKTLKKYHVYLNVLNY